MSIAVSAGRALSSPRGRHSSSATKAIDSVSRRAFSSPHAAARNAIRDKDAKAFFNDDLKLSVTEAGDKAAEGSGSHTLGPAKEVSSMLRTKVDAQELAQNSLAALLAEPIEFEKSTMPEIHVPYEPINGLNATAKNSSAAGPLVIPAIAKGKRRASSEDLAADAAADQDLFTFTIGFTFPPSARKFAAGLYNRGNTCYLNSVMQALAHTAPLVYTLRTRKLAELLGPMGGKRLFCAVEAMSKFSEEVFSTPRTAPKEFLNNLRYFAKGLRSGRQEDSHEYLRLLLDAMQQDCLAAAPKSLPPNDPIRETTFVHRIFGGRLRSRVSCESCRNNSDTFEAFLDLSIDVVGQNSVDRAIHAFTREDKLMGRDKYNCDHCKRRVNATKRFTIDKLPPVLTIHMKRFTITGGKINKQISFKENLTIRADCTSDGVARRYRLYAVVHHFGSSPNSGHYVATVRSPTGEWMRMDDDFASRQGSPADDKYAYMLFYVRDTQAKLQETLTSGTSAGLANGSHDPLSRKRPRLLNEDEVDEGAKTHLSRANISKGPPLRNGQIAYPMSSPMNSFNAPASSPRLQSRSSPVASSSSNVASIFAKGKTGNGVKGPGVLDTVEDLGTSVIDPTAYEDLIAMQHSPPASPSADELDVLSPPYITSSAGLLRNGLSRAEKRKASRRQRGHLGGKAGRSRFGGVVLSPFLGAGGAALGPGSGDRFARPSSQFGIGLEDPGSGTRTNKNSNAGGFRARNLHLDDYKAPRAFGAQDGSTRNGGVIGAKNRKRGRGGFAGQQAGRMQGKR